VTADQRAVRLARFASDHRAQPGKRRFAFHGYDVHLRLECPLCTVDAPGMAGLVDPVEAATLRRLIRR
jgi:hypothetical protein